MKSLRDSEKRLERVIPILLSSAAALPREEQLGAYLSDVVKAEERGYFLPDEDERLREIYASYLAVRASLHDCIQLICGGSVSAKAPNTFEEFLVAFAAATQLMRTARYLIDVADGRSVVRKKLDEPEPRYGLGEKSYTHIYKSMSSPRRWLAYMDSISVYLEREQEALQLLTDPRMAPVLKIIQEEKPYIEASHKNFIKRRLRYRLHSWKRRHRSGYRRAMFHLFRISGSAIAEMRYPAFGIQQLTKQVKMRSGKRVGEQTQDQLLQVMKPGDVIVTRHDDALSNLFLPGFWPHAALYVGGNVERAALGLSTVENGRDGPSFVEAKKDGVRYRPFEETTYVDAFVVLRPLIDQQYITQAVNKALSQLGKLYDFVFDFRQSDRLACTEVVYRAYHGLGGIEFQLEEQAGRLALPAEAMIRQMLASALFQPIALYGLNGSVMHQAEESAAVLAESLKPNFRLNRDHLA